MDMTIRALELFCGIGGFAAAVAGLEVDVVGAIDQGREALSVYRLNFPHHPAIRTDLERITGQELAAYRADFWWLSPPCQPYGIRGARRDLDDPRARSLVRIMDELHLMPHEALPMNLALENVEGFAVSEAHARLLDLLAAKGYLVRELRLCPSQLGVPSRRPRYYLAASRTGFNDYQAPPPCRMRPLSAYTDQALSRVVPEELRVPAEILARFGPGLRILDDTAPDSYTTCFTSGYGRSLMHAGSYLRAGDAVRRFAPEEIARLLRFPPGFRFPEAMSCRAKWRLVGNSLSVAAVREVLRLFPRMGPLSSASITTANRCIHSLTKP